MAAPVELGVFTQTALPVGTALTPLQMSRYIDQSRVGNMPRRWPMPAP